MSQTLAALPTPTPSQALPGGPRVLRVGVMHEGLLVAERYLTPEEGNPVVLGHHVGATVHTPWETGIQHLPLFQHKNGKWHLRVGPQLGGQISLDGRNHDLAAVRAKARAKGAGNDLLIPLDEGSAGRLHMRDTRILFQFSRQPQPPRRPPPGRRLQIALRRWDWTWVNTLLAMAVLQGLGMLVLLANYERPADDAGFLSVPDVKLFVPEKKPEVTKTEKTEEKGEKSEEKAPEEAPKETSAEKPKDDKPLDPSQRKAQIQQKLAKQTILKYIAAVSDGDNNNLVSADQVGARMSQAWDGATGFVGDAGDTRTGPRYGLDGATGRTGKVAGISDDELGGTGSEAVETGSVKEVKVKSRIQASGADEVFGAGQMDKASISQVVQRRLGAIKTCYERELKANPELGGKVVVQFTIEESGRVGNVKVLSDSTGEPRVGQCIAGQIARFKFPQPEGGSVTASYPFVLQPGT